VPIECAIPQAPMNVTENRLFVSVAARLKPGENVIKMYMPGVKYETKISEIIDGMGT